MKKFLLIAVCAMMCVAGMAQTSLSKDLKSAAKQETKELTKAGWKGAGADAKIAVAVERAYTFVADSANYVVAEGTAKGIDAKNAIAEAAFNAEKNALFKAREVYKARGVKRTQNNASPKTVLTLYRELGRKGGEAEALVRVALRIAQ